METRIDRITEQADVALLSSPLPVPVVLSTEMHQTLWREFCVGFKVKAVALLSSPLPVVLSTEIPLDCSF
jgi:hypothetical protein